jgi:uncharacterized protein (DUF433 family)
MASERAKNMKAVEEQLIVTDPEIMGGTPVFAGTRVPIESLFEWLEDEYTLDDYLDSFPSVERSQAVALLELAKKLILDENTLRQMRTAPLEA